MPFYYSKANTPVRDLAEALVRLTSPFSICLFVLYAGRSWIFLAGGRKVFGIMDCRLEFLSGPSYPVEEMPILPYKTIPQDATSLRLAFVPHLFL